MKSHRLVQSATHLDEHPMWGHFYWSEATSFVRTLHFVSGRVLTFLWYVFQEGFLDDDTSRRRSDLFSAGGNGDDYGQDDIEDCKPVLLLLYKHPFFIYCVNVFIFFVFFSYIYIIFFNLLFIYIPTFLYRNHSNLKPLISIAKKLR